MEMRRKKQAKYNDIYTQKCHDKPIILCATLKINKPLTSWKARHGNSNPGPWNVEAGGLRTCDQARLHRKSMSQNNN